MSASSKLVTCGMIAADFAIWAAMVRRILGIFSSADLTPNVGAQFAGRNNALWPGRGKSRLGLRGCGAFYILGRDPAALCRYRRSGQDRRRIRGPCGWLPGRLELCPRQAAAEQSPLSAAARLFQRCAVLLWPVSWAFRAVSRQPAFRVSPGRRPARRVLAAELSPAYRPRIRRSREFA